jgi:putative transcriptional regulator
MKKTGSKRGERAHLRLLPYRSRADRVPLAVAPARAAGRAFEHSATPGAKNMTAGVQSVGIRARGSAPGLVGTASANDRRMGAVMAGEELDVAELRKRLEMTQEQFARELGVTVGTVNRWENGRFQPSPLAERAIRKLTARVRRRKRQAERDGGD